MFCLLTEIVAGVHKNRQKFAENVSCFGVPVGRSDEQAIDLWGPLVCNAKPIRCRPLSKITSPRHKRSRSKAMQEAIAFREDYRRKRRYYRKTYFEVYYFQIIFCVKLSADSCCTCHPPSRGDLRCVAVRVQREAAQCREVAHLPAQGFQLPVRWPLGLCRYGVVESIPFWVE